MQQTPLDAWIYHKISGGEYGSGKLTRQIITNYQLKQLQTTINLTLAKSRFYRTHLRGVNTQISDLADLARLPFTTAEDIKQNPLDFLCVSQSAINRVVTLQSSGTTGQPKRIFFTKADQELTIDFFRHGMSTLVKPGEKVLILLPCDRPGSVGDLLRTGLLRLGASAVPYGIVKHPTETVEVLLREQVDALVGIPTQVLDLARRMKYDGTQGLCALKNVLLSTDHVPDAIVRELETIWGCKVFNHYGMTEMGLGGGVECEDLSGYHLREADMYFEIIAPDTGIPVIPGQTGEIVFTTLTRQGMPLIRYRTGDLARFLTETCPCGSVLYKMSRVQRRVNSNVQLLPGINLNMSELDEVLFALPGIVNFTATVKGNLDNTRLALEIWALPTAPKCTKAKVAKAVRTIATLRQAIEQDLFGVDVCIAQQESAVNNGTVKRTISDLRAERGG